MKLYIYVYPFQNQEIVNLDFTPYKHVYTATHIYTIYKLKFDTKKTIIIGYNNTNNKILQNIAQNYSLGLWADK